MQALARAVLASLMVGSFLSGCASPETVVEPAPSAEPQAQVPSAEAPSPTPQIANNELIPASMAADDLAEALGQYCDFYGNSDSIWVGIFDDYPAEWVELGLPPLEIDDPLFCQQQTGDGTGPITTYVLVPDALANIGVAEAWAADLAAVGYGEGELDPLIREVASGADCCYAFDSFSHSDGRSGFARVAIGIDVLWLGTQDR